jgi:hypothetical protein
MRIMYRLVIRRKPPEASFFFYYIWLKLIECRPMYRLTFLALLFSQFLYAQKVLYAQKDSLGSEKLTISGFVDVYYAYDFNKPVSGNRGTMVNGLTGIYSHNKHNEFAINQGMISLNYSSDRVRGAFSLQAGTYPQANYANEPAMFRNIYEAYAGYGITKKIFVDAGIFTSHIGFESAISRDNLTLTRSMMADNTPYYETGLKVTYETNDKLTITGLVLNGWQNIVENNGNKAFGTQVQLKPGEKIVLNSSTFFGKEKPSFDTISTMRYFHDFYTKIDLEKLSVIAAFDIGFQEKRFGKGAYVWYNPNLILSYSAFSKVSIGARVEYYHDRSGVIIYSATPNGFQTFAPSLNVDVKLGDNILWRTEGRIFISKDKVYIRNNIGDRYDPFIISSISIKI